MWPFILHSDVHFWIYIYLSVTILFHPKFMSRAKTDFDKVNFPALDGDVLNRPSDRLSVYIYQLIMFARVCSHVSDLNARNIIV